MNGTALLVVALASALHGCTSVYVVQGSGSIDAPNDQRIGRRLGPIVGDSDSGNTSNQKARKVEPDPVVER